MLIGARVIVGRSLPGSVEVPVDRKLADQKKAYAAQEQEKRTKDREEKIGRIKRSTAEWKLRSRRDTWQEFIVRQHLDISRNFISRAVTLGDIEAPTI